MRVRKVAGAAVRAGLWVVASRGARAARGGCERRRARGSHSLFRAAARAARPGRHCPRKADDSAQQLRFDAFGRRFEISLGSNGRAAWRASRSNSQLELYRGSIDGIAGSWVRLATKGGALHGMMWDGTQLYAIEPAAEVRDALAQPPPADAVADDRLPPGRRA